MPWSIASPRYCVAADAVAEGRQILSLARRRHSKNDAGNDELSDAEDLLAVDDTSTTLRFPLDTAALLGAFGRRCRGLVLSRL